MNQILVAATGLTIALALLVLGRKPKELLSNPLKAKEGLTDNQAKISLVSSKINFLSQSKGIKKQLEVQWERPTSEKDRINLKKYLMQSISSCPEQRLEAVRIAGLWGNRSVIEVLLRGLKDSDARVVCEAASAIEQFKKTCAPKKIQRSIARPPRNVALMR